jgi:hypothetical protein
VWASAKVHTTFGAATRASPSQVPQVNAAPRPYSLFVRDERAGPGGYLNAETSSSSPPIDPAPLETMTGTALPDKMAVEAMRLGQPVRLIVTGRSAGSSFNLGDEPELTYFLHGERRERRGRRARIAPWGRRGDDGTAGGSTHPARYELGRFFLRRSGYAQFSEDLSPRFLGRSISPHSSSQSSRPAARFPDSPRRGDGCIVARRTPAEWRLVRPTRYEQKRRDSDGEECAQGEGDANHSHPG